MLVVEKYNYWNLSKAKETKMNTIEPDHEIDQYDYGQVWGGVTLSTVLTMSLQHPE